MIYDEITYFSCRKTPSFIRGSPLRRTDPGIPHFSWLRAMIMAAPLVKPLITWNPTQGWIAGQKHWDNMRWPLRSFKVSENEVCIGIPPSQSYPQILNRNVHEWFQHLPLCFGFGGFLRLAPACVTFFLTASTLAVSNTTEFQSNDRRGAFPSASCLMHLVTPTKEFRYWLQWPICSEPVFNSILDTFWSVWSLPSQGVLKSIHSVW